ncbi:MAG: hypothetical protein KAT17_06285 [Candidatus Aminicenantes bacterium]|nr:hypothetical protein [Candidatus Aminicenantes bacterium]
MKKEKVFICFLLIFTAGMTLQVLAQPEPVEPVNWRKLTPFLSDLKGWEAKGEPSGSTVNMGNFKMSQVEREYTKNGIELEIQIIDGGYAPIAYAGFKTMSQFEIDTSDEYVKKTNIKDFTAIESYQYKRKNATIIILVADRFIVQLEASEIKDTRELKATAEQLDLKALAGLAK